MQNDSTFTCTEQRINKLGLINIDLRFQGFMLSSRALGLLKASARNRRATGHPPNSQRNARAGSKVKGEMHLRRRPATWMFAAVK